MADNADAFIAALKAKDFATVISTVKKFGPEVEADASPCKTDPTYKDVADQWDHEKAIKDAANADSDFSYKLMQSAMKNMAAIKADFKDATTKWDAGDYYGAGQAMGDCEKLALAPWWNTPYSEFLQ